MKIDRTENHQKSNTDINYFDDLKIINSILEKSYHIWSKYDKKKADISFIKKSLNDTLAIIFKNFKDIDLIAIEIKRNVQSFFDNRNLLESKINFKFGPLIKFSEKEKYPNEDYLWYLWKKDKPLFVTILGDKNYEGQSLEKNEFVIQKEIIDRCLKKNEIENKKIIYLIKNISIKHAMSDTDLKIAAKIALNSTKHSREFMEIHPKPPNTFHLPHKDQRNIVYIPVFTYNEAVGGIVIFSHYKLEKRLIPILRISLEYILFRIKMIDDLTISSMFINEQVKWKADYMFLQRIYHDIQKPIDKILIYLDDYFNSKYKNNNLQEKIYEQFDYFKYIISSTIGGSLDDLYKQASSSSQKNNISELIDDAIWIYEEDWKREGKTVEKIGAENAIIFLPKFLLIEVIRNLFTNAFKFSSSKILIKYNKPKTDWLYFQIDNDGIKINQDIIDSIKNDNFTPNYNKLGLKISKFIIETILKGEFNIKPTADGTSVSFQIKEIKINKHGNK